MIISDTTFLPVGNTHTGSKNHGALWVVLVHLPKGLAGSSVEPLVTVVSPGNTGFEIVTGL